MKITQQISGQDKTIRSYKINEIYRNSRSMHDPENQFLSWINIPGSAMGNSQGIRPLPYIHKQKINDLPAYLILVTAKETITGSYKPWVDIVDLPNKQIVYWGDAKFDESKSYDNFRGNQYLEKVYKAVREKMFEIVPPILHFTTPRSGYVKFSGLCILENMELSSFSDYGSEVRNFKCTLKILDAASVSIEWLHSRAKAVAMDEINKNAPEAWLDYVNQNIAFNHTESIINQSSIYVTALKLLEQNGFQINKQEILKHVTRDNLYDVKYKIPLLQNPLPFKVQFVFNDVKGELIPEDVAIMAARLSKGEQGIIITNSIIQSSTYNEIKKFKHPIHLINILG